MTATKLIADSWWIVVESNPQYHDKWLMDETWAQYLKKKRPNLGRLGNSDLNHGIFNRAIKKYFSLTEVYDETNQYRVFSCQFKGHDPLENKRRKITFYYFSSYKEKIPRKPDNIGNKAIQNALKFRIGASQIRIREESSESSDANPRSLQRRRTTSTLTSPQSQSEEQEEEEEEENQKLSTKLSGELNYWNSADAKNLFFSDSDKEEDNDPETNVSVIFVLERRIQHLRMAVKNNNWRNVILGGDINNDLTEQQIHFTKERCYLLNQAYSFALQNLGEKNMTWAECCEAACDSLNHLGIDSATSGETIQRWNRLFRSSERFDPKMQF